jgi:hypothetical protein
MGDYVVNKKPVFQMADAEIQAEANDLRLHIVVIEGELSKRSAWNKAEGREELAWLANVRTLRSRLMSRYLLIRPREKQINRAQHMRKKHD